MLRLTLLLLSLQLAACGGGSDSSTNEAASDNHGYGFSFDVQGHKGLKLRKTNATQSEAIFLEAIAEIVADCTGIRAIPPFVIVVPRGTIPQGNLGPRIGAYFSNPPLILLDEAWFPIAWRHEVVHYALDDATDNHASPLYARCEPLIAP